MNKQHLKPQLRISQKAIGYNIRHMQNCVGKTSEVTATVKANAYGLGLEYVTPALIEAGVKSFFVAREHEAYELDKVLGEGGYRIFIYNASAPFTYADHQNTFIPVLNSLEAINNIPADQECLMHIDTGMNRLGLDAGDMESLFTAPDKLKNLNVIGVMSHFVSSEDKGDPMSHQQFEKFMTYKTQFEKLGFTDLKYSICNSGGIFHDPKFHLDFVRPGISIYGGLPIEGEQNPMQPVAYLSAPIHKVFTLKKGETTGYNATFRADKDMKVATLQLGYADGIFRSLSNRGKFYIDGIACPILGRISMDLISISLENLETLPKSGYMVEILGDSQTIDDLARDADTIGYEILTSLGQRFERNLLIHK